MPEKLKVLVVAAHPDEADMYAGGLAARLADAGHGVKFLSLTNGDAGHWVSPRKALARRRAEEAYEAASLLGVMEYEIGTEHDGGLMDTGKLRKRVTEVIREWQADIVITFHDECNGHLDNRTAGRIARIAANLSTLGNFQPRYPALKQQPICLLMTDYGAVDHHRHDVVVDVTDSIERKLKACAAHATQFLEFAPHQRGLEADLPKSDDWDETRAFILKYWPEFMYTLDDMRPALRELLGDAGDKVEYAESFELADYGRKVTVDEVQKVLGLA